MSDFGIKKGYYMFRNSSNNIKTVGEITHLTKKFVICNFWKLEIPHTLPSRECFYENFKKDKLYCPISNTKKKKLINGILYPYTNKHIREYDFNKAVYYPYESKSMIDEKIDEKEDIIKKIKSEIPFVDIKPFSHNIISLKLELLAEKYGQEEVNKLILSTKLKDLGWAPLVLIQGGVVDIIEDDRCSGGCGKSDFNCRCGAGSPWY